MVFDGASNPVPSIREEVEDEVSFRDRVENHLNASESTNAEIFVSMPTRDII